MHELVATKKINNENNQTFYACMPVGKRKRM
jgi:hypothetical protein